MFVDPDGRDIDPTEFTDKNHQKAFHKMMKTEEGKEFFGRYMGANSELSVGDKTYKFNQNGKGGDREKDVLFLRSQKINMEGRLGCCLSYIKNSTTHVSGTGTQSNVIKGIWEVIDLRVGLTEDQALSTLGHEVFVHAEGDANRLSAIDIDIRKGNMTEREYIDRVGDIGNRVITDHSDLANDKVSRFKNAFNSLGRIDLYNDNVKNHEKYKNKPGNK